MDQSVVYGQTSQHQKESLGAGHDYVDAIYFLGIVRKFCQDFILGRSCSLCAGYDLAVYSESGDKSCNEHDYPHAAEPVSE